MSYLIAIDGGGTKTDCVLFDETGHILYRYKGNAGNATDIGVDKAKAGMQACLDELFCHAPGRAAALYGGVAGVLPNGDIYSDFVKRRYPVDKVRFGDDGCNLISGTLSHNDGCGMVCGTGSSLFVRIEGQPLRHIGGKGYLIDSGGSGFDLGREALRMALRAVDGRSEDTVLRELLSEKLGQSVDDRIIPMIHRGGRSYIASFASCVFAGCKLGDKVSMDIFNRQAALMADMTYPAEKFFAGRFPVVLGGGIAANFPEYVQAIKDMASPRAEIILQSAPPIYGAAVEAMWDCGIADTEAIKALFCSDYEKFESYERT